MTPKEAKEWLIYLVDREMEEEWKTTDRKDYIADCIRAKQWLMKSLGYGSLITSATMEADIEQYINSKLTN